MRARPARGQPGYLAFLAHRVSGLALALFLPVHFLVLARVLDGEAALDGFLHWTQAPAVKLAEAVLVGLLAVHLAGGVRVLLIELTPWRDGYDSLIAVTGGAGLATGLLFLLSAV